MLLLFLGVGMFFGSDGLGIQFNSPSAAQFIGMIALSIILFSGGMDTKYSEIKPVAVPGIILATLGVMLTALLTGGLIYCISGILTGVPSLTFTESLLLASVMSFDRFCIGLFDPALARPAPEREPAPAARTRERE